MTNKTNFSIGAVIALLVAAYFGIDLQQSKIEPAATGAETQQQKSEAHPYPNHSKSAEDAPQLDTARDDTQRIAEAFKQQQSNVQVQASGKVKAVLRDDNEGSRHQKFILSLRNGQTVLVAHNIDLSPRIEQLQKGDTVAFFGEYEYSAQGGVIHWTHHDPNQRHEDGWLKHQGKTYQ